MIQGMNNFNYCNAPNYPSISYISQGATRPPLPPMPPQGMPLNWNGHHMEAYSSSANINLHNKSNTFNKMQAKGGLNYPSQSKADNSPAQVLHCEPCDKEFTSFSAFDAHKKTHEPCTHPGCSFTASKKVVIAHFHSIHGLYSGSGFKMIDVEGQKFRVLLGTSPEEVNQWRTDRKKNFPTSANVAQKKEFLVEVKNAGGTNPRNNNRKRKSSEEGATQSSKRPSHYAPSAPSEDGAVDGNEATEEKDGDQEGQRKKRGKCIDFGRGKCIKGDTCDYSHDFEPRVCAFFVKFCCRKGSRCYNIHQAGERGKKTKKTEKEDRVAQEEGKSEVVDGVTAEGGGEGLDAVKEGGGVSEELTNPISSSGLSRNQEKKLKLKQREEKKRKSEEGNGNGGTKGGLRVPPPLAGGERGTLLRKLLSGEVAREESILLQSLRFIVQSRYFLPADLKETTTEAHHGDAVME